MPWTALGELRLHQIMTSDEIALYNGRRGEERHAEQIAAWAERNPEAAERVAAEQARFAAADADEQRRILNINNDSIRRAA